MKKKYLIASMALLAFLGACNDDYNDQFDIDSAITDVKNITYTLTTSDYGSIAANSTNQELALSKDPENGTYVTALNELSTNRYFTDLIPAEDYIPAFLAAKYPNADSGSNFTITYNLYQEPSDYLSDFSSVSSYTLTSSDYTTVWGDNIKASYLAPSTLSDIPSILASNVSGASEGDIMVVNYAYSDQEPSSGGGSASTTEPTWTEVGFLTRSAGTNWNFVNVGPVSIADYVGETVNIGFKYTSTTSSGATWELKNFKVMDNIYQDVYVFALQEDGTYEQTTSFSGAGSYVFVAMGADGQYYPFGRPSSDTANYGYLYPDPITVTDGAITAADAADYVITVAATDAGYTMQNAINRYIYMSTSGSYNSFNFSDAVGTSGYDWTITAAYNTGLFNITNVATSKTVKMNYYNGSYSYGCYPSSTVEGHVLYENAMSDDSDFSIYDIDISSLSYVWKYDSSYKCWKGSAYANSTYYATESYLVSPAIEIAEDATLPHFTVDEAFRYGSADDITVWVSTDFSTSSAASASVMSLQAASTRAAASNNAAGVYVYDGSSWTEYTSDEAAITAIDETVYTALNASYIASPETTLPIYLSEQYPYAAAEDKVGVVYYASESALTIDEYTFDGSAWAETPSSTEETMTFAQSDSGINANLSTYLSVDFTGNNDGGFTTQDILLDGLTYVWATTASYGWKASAYVSGNKTSESWLVSPAIKLTRATAPVMNFTHVHQYVSTGENTDYLNLMISNNYSGDVTTATWTTLEIPNWATGASGDWTFVDSGEIDLKDYVGSTVYIAFKYVSSSAAAPTWEIKDITIKEAEGDDSEEDSAE
ncbi:MAG: choice-of-anchor J domain-containing protein [Bacteroides sp.]|nr:choice-of-anchor J domain-containing protein [Bacteroides sp.]